MILREIYILKSQIFLDKSLRYSAHLESKNSLKHILLETIRCTGVKERTLREIARGACVMTGVAPLSLRGWNGDSWNNGSSAYCRIPRGEPPLVAAPPRLVVTPRNSLRAHMSFYLSAIVQLTRRIRRTKTLLQVLGTAVGASSRRRQREILRIYLRGMLSSARPTG